MHSNMLAACCSRGLTYRNRVGSSLSQLPTQPTQAAQKQNLSARTETQLEEGEEMGEEKYLKSAGEI